MHRLGTTPSIGGPPADGRRAGDVDAKPRSGGALSRPHGLVSHAEILLLLGGDSLLLSPNPPPLFGREEDGAASGGASDRLPTRFLARIICMNGPTERLLHQPHLGERSHGPTNRSHGAHTLHVSSRPTHKPVQGLDRRPTDRPVPPRQDREISRSTNGRRPRARSLARFINKQRGG